MIGQANLKKKGKIIYKKCVSLKTKIKDLVLIDFDWINRGSDYICI